MAANGYFDKKITSWLTLRLRWVANSQSIENNTTNLTVTAQLISSASNGKINSTASKDIEIKINGTSYTSTCTVGLSGNTTKNLWAKTVNVAHNTDGSKSVALACTLGLDVTLSDTPYKDQTVSGTAALNTIPRASTFTRSGTATMGNAQTITITRASSSFTHKLYYTWGGTKTLIASNIGTSYEWSPAVSMAAKIPNATSGSCVLTCETYNGSTLIGTKTLTFTLSVPSSVKPTISAFTLAEAVSGLAAQFGGFVNTKSKIKYTVTAAGAQGSTIKSYAVTIAGQQLTAQTATTAVISLNGVAEAGTSFTASVTVTDSRGRTTSATTTYVVFPYSTPTISCFEVDRCDADGTLNDDGEYLSVTVAVNIAPVNNKNTVAYGLLYKGTNDAEYSSIDFTGSGYSYNGTTYYTAVIFSTDHSFDILFTASDYFTTVAKTTNLSTAKPILDILADGSGMAFNKVAELSGVADMGFKHRFFSGIMPLILPEEANLNDYTTPNFFASRATAAVVKYLNCPVTSGTFDLEVTAVGNEGQIKQRLTTCSKTAPKVFERFYYQSAWGEWLKVSDFGNTLLWDGSSLATGGYYMTASHTITLSEAVSKQPTGIVLVFSYFENGKAQNNSFNYVFVPKTHVALHNDLGVVCQLSGANPFHWVASKYLYVSDLAIKGNNYNNTTGTAASGITYHNEAYVLRYVVGV